MTRTIVESPFAAPTEDGMQRNLRYARACMLDSLRRGEAPFASHLLYPQVLDDTVPELREQGINAGFLWAQVASVWVFYTDLGMSPGMQGALETAREKHGASNISLRRLWPRLEWAVPAFPSLFDIRHQAEFCRRVLSDTEIDRLLSEPAAPASED